MSSVGGVCGVSSQQLINVTVYAAVEVKSSPLEAAIMIVGLLNMAELGAWARTRVHAAAKLIMWAGRGAYCQTIWYAFISLPVWSALAATRSLSRLDLICGINKLDTIKRDMMADKIINMGPAWVWGEGWRWGGAEGKQNKQTINRVAEQRK